MAISAPAGPRYDRFVVISFSLGFGSMGLWFPSGLGRIDSHRTRIIQVLGGIGPHGVLVLSVRGNIDLHWA